MPPIRKIFVAVVIVCAHNLYIVWIERGASLATTGGFVAVREENSRSAQVSSEEDTQGGCAGAHDSELEFELCPDEDVEDHPAYVVRASEL